MKLIDLLERMEYTCLQGDVNTEITTLVYDSRKAEKGSVFVCIPGTVRDAHDFAPDVVEKGAVALIVERQLPIPDVTQILVKNARLALAEMSAAYFGHPAEKLTTIGITGTKGKTTTTYMVRSILESAGYPTGLIGTIETIIGDECTPAGNTTPESYIVQESFAKMVDAGLKCVVMEVSSQGLMMDRVAGFTFDYGIFTNLEKDHIGPNEHKDMDDYIHWKSVLFQRCKVGILNGDDSHLEQILKDHTCEVELFGMREDADYYAKDLHLEKKPGFLGIRYEVCGKINFPVEIDIPGRFSVYNSLTAIAICNHFNVAPEIIQKALSEVKVKGRVELVPVSDRYTLMIDYAHNAMALESLLTTLREYHPKRLVCMFGCGGNRSKVRRYEMGEVSSRLADLTVVTSDNPRNEDPEAIIDDIVSTVEKGPGEFVRITDRKEAIHYCMKHAQEGDVIVLAGKGHEDYQEICGKKYPMDERVLIQEILAEDPACGE